LEALHWVLALKFFKLNWSVLVQELVNGEETTTDTDVDSVLVNLDQDTLASELVDTLAFTHEHDLQPVPVWVVVDVLSDLLVNLVILDWDVDSDARLQVDDVVAENLNLALHFFNRAFRLGQQLKQLELLLLNLKELLLKVLDVLESLTMALLKLSLLFKEDLPMFMLGVTLTLNVLVSLEHVLQFSDSGISECDVTLQVLNELVELVNLGLEGDSELLVAHLPLKHKLVVLCKESLILCLQLHELSVVASIVLLLLSSVALLLIIGLLLPVGLGSFKRLQLSHKLSLHLLKLLKSEVIKLLPFLGMLLLKSLNIGVVLVVTAREPLLVLVILSLIQRKQAVNLFPVGLSKRIQILDILVLGSLESIVLLVKRCLISLLSIVQVGASLVLLLRQLTSELILSILHGGPLRLLELLDVLLIVSLFLLEVLVVGALHVVDHVLVRVLQLLVQAVVLVLHAAGVLLV